MHLSKYLRLVKNGEAVAISEHGKEVALITPSRTVAQKRSRLWELVRLGKVDWNGKKPHFKGRKLIKIKGKPLSQTVIEMREEERF